MRKGADSFFTVPTHCVGTVKKESDPIWSIRAPWLSLIGAALLLGCSAASGEDHVAPHIAVDLTRTPQAVEVRGLGRTAARRLQRLAADDSTWPTFVAVYVERGATDTASVPPVIGRYVASGDRVRFEPRFPFAAGVAYRVDVDTAALGGPEPRAARSAPLTHRFALPSVTHARTTRITGVYPSVDRVPSNLLRWYIETSASMEPGNALEHVHLMDEAGRDVPGAFLALDQELWDRERRRLTLLFDPGRVKRGVRTNVESGAPLVAGRRYRLVIDDGWTDGTGAPLASRFEHAFEAVEADRRSPEPDRWRLTVPGASTRVPLQVSFGESLDHALAARMLVVLDPDGERVAGSVALAAGDSTWTFTPTLPWLAGDYSLRVGGALEDLAGNNVVRVFDVDRRVDSVGVDRDVAGATRMVRVRVR